MKHPNIAASLGNQGGSFLLAWLLAFISGAAPGLAADKQPGGRLEDYLKRLQYASVPFEQSDSGEFLLESALSNGRKPAFLVDTGCTITTLNPKSSTGLKSPSERGVVLEDSHLGQLTNSSFVIVDELGLGAARFLNQPAKVKNLDLDYIQSNNDAILGLDFLVRNYCLIDCGGRRLFFRAAAPSEQQSKALAESLRRSGFVEINLSRGNALFMEARVNDKPVRLLVDTGGDFSVLDETQVSRLALKIEKREQPRTGTLIKEDYEARLIGIGKVGAHKMRVTTIKLQLGSREWKAAHFGVVNLKAWNVSASQEEVQGLLGRELLIQTGALIDPAGNKLWLQPETKAH